MGRRSAREPCAPRYVGHAGEPRASRAKSRVPLRRPEVFPLRSRGDSDGAWWQHREEGTLDCEPPVAFLVVKATPVGGSAVGVRKQTPRRKGGRGSLSGFSRSQSRFVCFLTTEGRSHTACH